MENLTEEPNQDLTDLVARIVDDLVSNKLIKDCTDTDLNDEWDANDIIYTHIEKYFLNN